jgi:hypothetical protein
MPHQAGLTIVFPESVPLPALMSSPRPRLPEMRLSRTCSPDPWWSRLATTVSKPTRAKLSGHSLTLSCAHAGNPRGLEHPLPNANLS